MKANEIYSDKLLAGKRTYFFDIKKSEQDDLYLGVSESKKTGNGFERHGILVFEENIKEFIGAFLKLLTRFEELKEPKPTVDKTYSVEEIRKSYSKAYLPWTIEDDQEAKTSFF